MILSGKLTHNRKHVEFKLFEYLLGVCTKLQVISLCLTRILICDIKLILQMHKDIHCLRCRYMYCFLRVTSSKSIKVVLKCKKQISKLQFQSLFTKLLTKYISWLCLEILSRLDLLH